MRYLRPLKLISFQKYNMINVVRKDLENQLSNITISIPREDYEKKWQQELSNTQKKAQLKGFRKGKTPLSYVRKLYGQSLLGDIINDMIQKELQDYLTKEKIHYLGQPIPAEDQALADLDINNMKDLEFKFDVGLSPEIEIKGIQQTVTLPYDETIIPATLVDSEWAQLLKRGGEHINTDAVIEAGDMVTISAKETSDGKEKKDGWQMPITFLADDIPSEDLKKELLTKKKGDSISFKITDIEKNQDPAHIRKHLLQLDENDLRDVSETFNGVIDEVRRMQDAEPNQEFLDKAFGPGEVNSEEQAKAFIKSVLKRKYDYTADSILFREIQDSLLKENVVSLPDAFLKRWLLVANEGTTQEVIESEYDTFAKNLQWTIVKNKLTELKEITVTEVEIQDGFRNYYANYFGMQIPEDMMNGFLTKVMQNKEQIEKMYEDILIDKLFKSLKDEYKLDLKAISIEDLEIKAAALRQQHTHDHDHDHDHDHHDHNHDHHDHEHDHSHQH